MAKSTHQQAGINPLLTKKDTAEFFSVTERTIDRWLLEGTLPIKARVVIGGSVRFRAAVLVEHFAAAIPNDRQGGKRG